MGERERLADWQSRLAGFDFEVTAYDWLLVIIEYQTGAEHVFHNDPIGVEDFIESHDFIYAGYNCKHYDNYILKGVLNRYPPEEIKKINDWIIVDKQDGWTYPFDQPFIKLPPTTDLMLDLPLRQSLKELEGNMCMDIRESTVDFNIDHPWTKEEFEEMLFYCKHDVRATVALLEERMGYLDAKVFNGTREGLTPEESLYRTNGQLSSIALGAKKQEFDDERDILFPNTVKWENIPKEVVDFFNQTFDEKIPSEILFNKKLKINFLGMEWTFAWGGVHASLENVILVSENGYVLILADVTSLYPSLMEEYGLTSRAIPDPEKFFDMKRERIDAKHKGDKATANNLKVPINTVYGISLQQFSDCYDPRNGRSVCVSGQLLLTDLCVELYKGCKTIQFNNVNTDGVGFAVHISELDKAYEIMEEWQKRTRLELEIEKIKRIILKDINNYILEKEDGSLKVKGAYVSDYKPSFKHNSLSIVATAIVKYFTENIPVEKTILTCDDPFKFQLIAKTGSTYQRTVQYLNGEEVDVQKVNRVYAVNDEKYGVIKKVKKQYLTLDEDGERRYYINLKGKRTYKKNWETDEGGDFFIKKDTTQNCPDHAYIDNGNTITIDTINKEWYIKLAKKRINDFLGIKETKGGKKKMPAAKTVKLEPKPALYKKIFDLGVALAKKPFVADGYNSQQGYEYVRSAYYRKVLGEACREVGLVFKFTLNNRLFTPLEKTKNMNLTTVLGMMCLIDPDTGEHEDYSVIADGSDNLDKGVYKAETMAIKYFVLNNFLLPETQDELDPEDGKQDKQVAKEEEKAVTIVAEEKPKPTPPATPTQRKEAKEEVVNNRTATPEFVQEILEVMDVLRSSNKTDSKGKVYDQNYGQKTYTNLQKCLNGELAMISNTEAVKLMTTFEERLSELGLD